MLYLLDANVIITAHNLYYPLDVVPEFWAWLAYQCESNQARMPQEIFDEVREGGNVRERDPLFAWVQDHKELLVLDEDADADLVQQVVYDGYANDLTDEEIEALGQDPFLIAYTLASNGDRCVVTNEASSRRRKRQNRRIPDVCDDLGVRCTDPFAMLRALGFTTRWVRP